MFLVLQIQIPTVLHFSLHHLLLPSVIEWSLCSLQGSGMILDSLDLFRKLCFKMGTISNAMRLICWV
ncbi:hypothetical protein RIF29_19231 [Crotalaria pallida]|uniref:Uncharacterized protein n=1 Tax=Crotalaria pallida TaxID=3830 RepID=A0AAN9EZ24_CROPI